MKNFIIPLLLLLISQVGHSQNLESLSSKAISVDGTISLGGAFYQADGRDNRRSPYSYFVSANPNFKIFGIDVPVSFTYRDQEGTVSNPFNRYSINPTYKWISLHLGNTGINLHPYVLSGQIIRGAGVSLKPGKWELTALQGRIENPLAQVDTIVAGATLLDYYERNAQAIKFGFGTRKNHIHITGFRAKDDLNSNMADVINQRLIKPEENIVIGTSFKLSPISWLSLYSNIAASAHTANQNSAELFEDEDLLKIQEDFGDVITLNFSSKLQFAGDAGIDLKFRNFGIGGEYKRVDPLYKSLGTYYFLEDYENILFKLNFSLFQNKIRFNSRVGLQRNNLNNLRSVTNTRQIANIQINVKPTRSFSTSLRYANYQTDRNPGLVELNDTLRYTRASQTFAIVPRLIIQGGSNTHSISLSASQQVLEDLLNGIESDNGIQNTNLVLNYNLRMKPSQLSLGINLIANQNEILERVNERIGTKLNISKKLLNKKLRLSSSIGYLQNFLNSESNGSSITARVGFQYRQRRKFSVNFNTNYLKRNGIEQPYQEIRGSLRLNFIIPSSSSK